ncbi:MAG: 50S ribosomal protein L30 [Clostridia bacterium]|nr:50S ribosomal protein L30 [Clostridia bacterium]
MIKITLKKSLIGGKPAQIATAASLGLKKIGDSITLNQNDAVAGKIKVLSHLVTVETVENN